MSLGTVVSDFYRVYGNKQQGRQVGEMRSYFVTYSKLKSYEVNIQIESSVDDTFCNNMVKN